jgi:hypothetical protein
MRFFALLLTALTAVNPVWTQTNAGGRPGEADPPPELRVRVVDDPGPARPNSTSIRAYAAQVTDSLGGPVADAAVSLRLPDEGPTGHFEGGLRAWVVYTDQAGLARFPVIQWEGGVGLSELRVTAAKGSAHAGFLVEERVGTEISSSVPPPTVSIVRVLPGAIPPTPTPSVETPQPSQALGGPLPVSESAPSLLKDTGHALTPDSAAMAPKPATLPEPAVSITSSGAGANASNRKKWLVIMAIGAAAGIGVALTMKGRKSTSSASSTVVTFGTPTYPTSPSH